MHQLYLDGNELDADCMIEQMNEKKDLPLGELYIAHVYEDTTIASIISNLSPNLKTLSLSESMVSLNNAHSIANFIVDSALIKLELSTCGIENDALSVIISSIEKSSLQILKLSDISFVDEEITSAIVGAIEKSTLAKLSFTMCNFTHDKLIAIMGAIKESSLTTLMLNNIMLHDGCVAVIADCITNAKLNKLSLRWITLYETSVRSIFEAIRKSSIKTLDVSSMCAFNNFNIINDLMQCRSITKIKFNDYQFSIDDRIAIVDSIQKNNSFEHIHFDSEKINDQLLTKVCNLLKNSYLKSFALSYCSTLDMNKMIDAIKHSSITSFQFSAFNSTNEVISIICDLLEDHICALEKLHLNLCIFTNTTIAQLLPSIRKSSIIKFSINDYKSINKKLREEIEHILQARQQMLRRRANTKSAQQ